MSTDHEDLDWYDEAQELAEILRDAMNSAFQDASPEEMEDALFNVLESMSAAEAFNFTKALQQIGKGAGRALSDPVVGQILRTALPIAGGVAGTAIGGPAGTALGSNLGAAAAKALPAGRTARAPAATRTAPRPAAQTRPAPPPPVANGSAAAVQGLVLTQQPEVLQGLVSLAMGQKGKKSVNGVPVAEILSLLSSVFGQAAADADELLFHSGETDDEAAEAYLDETLVPSGRSLYVALMDAENSELLESEDTP